MKFTLSWLKNYLETDHDIDFILEKLTDIGLEVEHCDNGSQLLKDFTVAKIISTKPHQDSDKLKICQVDIGTGNNLQIVCGAANARSGIKVAYAKIGSIIPANNVKIKKSKIRGVESFGMLCSESELAIGKDSQGIAEIDGKFAIGTTIDEVYNDSDVIIDVNITPNRGDCLGVYGIARDLASAGVGKLKKLELENIKPDFKTDLKVQRQDSVSNLCPYFSGYHIRNITNNQSPDWLKNILAAIGVNSVNAIVDITNYIMYSFNQPLHAYDLAKIDGNLLKVNKSKAGVKFSSLKDTQHNLLGEEIIIEDKQKILSLAGIMGSDNSKVEDLVNDIFLEAAYFDPVMIAKTGRKLNILSESRYRFERSVDISTIKNALDLAAKLIIEICGGQISNRVESGSDQKAHKQIAFNLSMVKSILGFEIDYNKIKEILLQLGFEVTKSDQDILQLTVPTFRHDISIAEDLIEEVIRIYGYDKITSIPLKNITANNSNNYLSNLRLRLSNLGLDEIISWSFIESKYAANFTETKPHLQLVNAISDKMDYMRPSLLHGLLIALKKNQLRGFDSLSFYEIGKVFHGVEEKDQLEFLTGVRFGKNKDKNHYKDDRLFDVMDVKKDLFAALNELGFNERSVQLISEDLPSYLHPFRSAIIRLGRNNIGYFGEIHPAIAKKYGIASRVNVFQLNLDILPKKVNKLKNKPFIRSDFQEVNRDFSFIFDKSVKVGDLLKLVKNINPQLITDVNIFDIYQGENIDSEKKSIAFGIKITPNKATLSSKEIDDISDNIIAKISSSMSGVLRDS